MTFRKRNKIFYWLYLGSLGASVLLNSKAALGSNGVPQAGWQIVPLVPPAANPPQQAGGAPMPPGQPPAITIQQQPPLPVGAPANTPNPQLNQFASPPAPASVLPGGGLLPGQVPPPPFGAPLGMNPQYPLSNQGLGPLNTTTSTSKYNPQSDNPDPCRFSAKADAQKGCAGTVALSRNSTGVDVLATMTGQLAVQTAGTAGTMAAMTSSSQAGMMEAQANTSIAGGAVQTTLGGLKTLLGVGMIMEGQKREKIGQEFTAAAKSSNAQDTKLDSINGTNATTNAITSEKDAGYVTSTNELGQKILTNYNINKEVLAHETITKVDAVDAQANIRQTQLAQRQIDNDNHVDSVKSAVRQVASEATAEQGYAGATIKGQGLMMTMSGFMQGAAGGTALAAGVIAKKNAEKLKNLTSNQAPTIAPPGTASTSTGTGQTPAITGNGSTSLATAAPTPVPSGAPLDPNMLGQGFNPGYAGNGVSGPAPGELVPNSAPTGGSGGGGASVPVAGGTAPATDSNNVPKDPSAAPNNNANSLYSGNGGAFSNNRAPAQSQGGNSLSDIAKEFMKQFAPNTAEPTGRSIATDMQQRTNAEGGISADKNTSLFTMIQNGISKQIQSGNLPLAGG